MSPIHMLVYNVTLSLRHQTLAFISLPIEAGEPCNCFDYQTTVESGLASQIQLGQRLGPMILLGGH